MGFLSRVAAARCGVEYVEDDEVAEGYRQTGRTSKQMAESPHGAVFVWCNGSLGDARQLAKRLGREDLEIVTPCWLEEGWVGRELRGLVIDHALGAIMTDRQFNGQMMARARVRQEAR